MPCDKPKIVMTNISGRGGISQNSYCLATALAQRQVNLVYLVPRVFEFNGAAASFNSFPVHSVFEQLYDKRRLWRKAAAYLYNLYKLKSALRSWCPAICHIHEIKLPLFDLRWLRWCHRNGIKVVYTAHDILHPERQKIADSLRAFFREVDAIIANAHENKNRILNHFQVEANKIRVIVPGNLLYSGNGYPFSERDKSQARKTLGLNSTAPVVLFFGYIREYKGLDLLLEAVSYLHRLGEKLNLLIVGQPVADFAKYQQMIERARMTDCVHLYLRYVPEPEVSKFFLAADVVALPYRRIYQSGVVPVAYAHARPVIATAVGGVAEMIEEGQSGMLVPPADSGALAKALKDLLQEPVRLKSMGEYAYRLAQEKYSWSHIADETIKVYQSLLD